MRRAVAWAVIVGIGLAGAGDAATPDHGVWTLYRNSVVDVQMRIHVATFDADQSSEYNADNCWTAARLFEDQPGVSVAYWCEPGRYREG